MAEHTHKVENDSPGQLSGALNASLFSSLLILSSFSLISDVHNMFFYSFLLNEQAGLGLQAPILLSKSESRSQGELSYKLHYPSPLGSLTEQRVKEAPGSSYDEHPLVKGV